MASPSNCLRATARRLGAASQNRRLMPKLMDEASINSSHVRGRRQTDSWQRLLTNSETRPSVSIACTSAEWSRSAPPCAAHGREHLLRDRGVGQRHAHFLAPTINARLRSFWCSRMRKPGLKVRLIIRSACTSRMREEANPPISACAHLGRVGAGLAREGQGLADRLDVQRDDDLVADLAGLAGAVLGADMGDVLAHQLEQRLARARRRRRGRRP